ncbi:hypothetical protein LWC35_09340 [Pseudonocardia kujensis]|uniref:hypothetical protein n=1 Tax=Pseudonocardia kujensis TaxID=1128675 RepID=UPI001E43D8C6|nr:hypothetical protein [Pseudonocardia kujensis]MCE0763110.1 hypothetical protein [Pseudonocardia kujensis]
MLVLPTPTTTEAPPRRTTALLAAAVGLLGGLYLWRGLAVPHPVAGQSEAGLTTWFGVDRWAFVGRGWAITFASLATAAGLAVGRWPERARVLAADATAALGRRTTRLIVAAVGVGLFWLLSDRTENLDGSLLQGKFEAAPGGFATHDEMLELYLHSRLWAGLHAMWGWDVAQTYRLVSCLSGGAAVLLALRIARRFDQPLLVLGLLAGGAWVMVFFGDVENYTLTAVVALAYLAGALRFLDDEDGSVWPLGLLLGLGVLCHLETLVLGPSLLVLVVIAVRRGRRLDGVAAFAAVPAVLGLGLWWFDEHGLPIAQLVSGSQISAQGGDWSRFLLPDGATGWWLQLQLVLLLAPAVVLLPACRFVDVRSVFFGVASAGALLMVLVWRAQLGVFDDWNLYAIAAPPLTLLVVSGLRRASPPWATAFVVLAGTQTLAWVLENHA